MSARRGAHDDRSISAARSFLTPALVAAHHPQRLRVLSQDRKGDAARNEGGMRLLSLPKTQSAMPAVESRVEVTSEQVSAGMKTVSLLRKLRHRGGERVDWVMTFTAALHHMVRMRSLLTGA